MEHSDFREAANMISWLLFGPFAVMFAFFIIRAMIAIYMAHQNYKIRSERILRPDFRRKEEKRRKRA